MLSCLATSFNIKKFINTNEAVISYIPDRKKCKQTMIKYSNFVFTVNIFK